MENAALTLEQEMDDTLEENSGNVLAEIDAALERIDDGTYGTCASCGETSLLSAWRRFRTRRCASTASGARRSGDRDGAATAGRRPGRFLDRRARARFGARRSLGAGVWQWVGLVAVALAALAADQLTKSVVVRPPGPRREGSTSSGPFSIHHVQNSGIAFGLFSSATAAVIVLTSVAVAWMLVFFARSGARHPILPAALGLVIGGSLSNLVDRVRLGHVTDFIDFHYWPAFNLADSFIVVGVAPARRRSSSPTASRAARRITNASPTGA